MSIVAHRRRTDMEVAEALRASHGLVSVAAQALGVSISTVYRRADTSATVRQALEDTRNQTLDLAEQRLIEAVDRGEQWAIQFILRTLGKHRGYTERVEMVGPDGEGLKLEIEVIDSRSRVEVRMRD